MPVNETQTEMRWSQKPPTAPGFYWYKHHDAKKLEDGTNEPEPVRLMADGRVLFLGDWRGHDVTLLGEALWGERIAVPG